MSSATSALLPGLLECGHADWVGDPIDALVLMDEPTFTGCKVKCRVIGIFEAEQRNKKSKERNDVIVAVAA